MHDLKACNRAKGHTGTCRACKHMYTAAQVGTKSDLGEAVVSGPEAQAVADAAGVTYIPTSALNNQNVTSLFQRLGEDMAAQRVAANV